MKNQIRRSRVFGVDCTVDVYTGEKHPNMNTICIAPSGSGKTGAMVIPSILANDGESMVISDCKRQLSKILTPILESRGYVVRTVDFVEPSKGCAYDPLNYIGRDRITNRCRQLDVMNLSEAITAVLNYRDSDPFWISSARDLISCCIAYVMDYMPPEERTMCSVIQIYHQICSESVIHRKFKDSESTGYYVQCFEDLGASDPRSYAYQLYRKLRGVFVVDRTWGCIQQFANVALSPYECEEGMDMFYGNCSIDLTELSHRKSVIFLNTNCIDCSLEPLVSIFYTQMIHSLIREADENGGCLEVPVHFFLDDFASSVKIPKFERLISMIRSYDMSVSMFLQSISQLDDMYNDAQRNVILSNCQYQVFLGAPADMQTIEFLAQRTDKLNSTVMCIPEDVVTIIERNQKPRTVKMIEPYSWLKKYSSPKPAQLFETDDEYINDSEEFDLDDIDDDFDTSELVGDIGVPF